MKRYLLAVPALVAAVAVAGFVAQMCGGSNNPEAGTNGCGKERWLVKTLSDPDVGSVNLTPVSVNVSDLRALMPAPKNATARLRQERMTFTVIGHFDGFKEEADGDIHIVLSASLDPKLTMIAEVPDPPCVANLAFREQIRVARQAVIDLCGAPSKTQFLPCAGKPLHDAVQVTGVAFLDFQHGQRGVAPNAIEIHPVLQFSEDP